MADNIARESIADLEGKYITFFIGDTIYGIELLHVIELINIQPITIIPKIPSYY